MGSQGGGAERELRYWQSPQNSESRESGHDCRWIGEAGGATVIGRVILKCIWCPKLLDLKPDPFCPMKRTH